MFELKLVIEILIVLAAKLLTEVLILLLPTAKSWLRKFSFLMDIFL